MENVEQIAKTTLEQLEHLLNSKKVISEPIVAGENTIIPLVSLGFCFGAGAGGGKRKESDEGTGGGTGAGGGIKPVAVIVVSKDGVRVEPLKRGATPVLEKVVDAVSRAAQRRGGESSEK